MPDVWRNEVQAHLERYKRRRGRRIEGAFTMRFPFPPEEPLAATPEEEEEPQEVGQLVSPSTDDVLAPLIVAEPSSEPCETVQVEEEIAATDVATAPATTASAAALAPEPEEEPVPVIEVSPRPLPRRKVIAFPSPSYPQREAARHLADPVQPEQLRILEVPEELQAVPATPFLEGLLDAPARPAPRFQADAMELPCATVRGPRRVGAAAVDAAMVLVGMVIFAAAASRLRPELPPAKFLIAGAVAVAVLLWASYQYLFLVYGGQTLGMRVTGVRLQTFKGRTPNFRRRQWRVFGLYLSVLSLGMGVLWFFVDIDSLCWHDRISQTFPAAANKS